jgi:hypothetical protein
MTPMPMILQEEFGATHVEEVPYDIRRSNWDANVRINLNADKFPNADWDKVHAMSDAMSTVADVWLNPEAVS